MLAESRTARRSVIISSLLALALLPAPCLADRVVLVAGGGDGADGGPAVGASLVVPFGVDFDRAGNMYIAEYRGQRVRKVDPQGKLTTVAGTGMKGDTGDGGPARAATFNDMHNLVVHPVSGDIYVSDTLNSKVRKIDARTGKISTVAGSGARGYAGDDGPALQASFNGIFCVALDPRGESLYLADLGNRRIRKVHLASGVVSTVAGNGKRGVPDDGADARSAPLVDPRAVAVDGKGNVYVLERSGHALRVVDPAGKIRTVAGTGKAGLSGDGGPARQAQLNGPKHLVVDQDGSVIIADTENHVIRRYLPASGQIVRVAGAGKKGSAGVGGPPEELQMSQPHGVCVHASGTLYIVDSFNGRVLRLER